MIKLTLDAIKEATSTNSVLKETEYALPSAELLPIDDVDNVQKAIEYFDRTDASDSDRIIMATNIMKKVYDYDIPIDRNARWYSYVDLTVMESLLNWDEVSATPKHPELDDIFQELIDKEATFDSMVPALTKEMHNKFKIKIDDITLINNDAKFFGMRLIPRLTVADKSGLRRFVFNTAKTNSTIRKDEISYILEVDSRLLYDKRIKASAREITGVLMHEIGHIHVETSVIYRLRKAVIEVTNSRLGVNSKSIKVFLNYDDQDIRNVIMYHTFYNRELQLVVDEEMMADEFIIKSGYAQDVNNLITRLVGMAMLDLQKSKRNKYSEADKLADDKVIVGWGVETINSMTWRTNKISEELELMANQLNKGTVFKNLVEDMFGKVKNFDLRGKVKHNDTVENILQESFAPVFGTNIKKFQRYIDEITLDAEAITDIEYKGYVIRRIHDKLDDLNMAYKTSRDDNETDLINKYHKQLTDLRSKVMDMKIQEKRYGVLVKYPVGYEG